MEIGHFLYVLRWPVYQLPTKQLLKIKITANTIYLSKLAKEQTWKANVKIKITNEVTCMVLLVINQHFWSWQHFKKKFSDILQKD